MTNHTNSFAKSISGHNTPSSSIEKQTNQKNDGKREQIEKNARIKITLPLSSHSLSNRTFHFA